MSNKQWALNCVHGNPVTLRTGSGKEICELDWDTFKQVYVMD